MNWRYIALQIVKERDRAAGHNLDKMSASGSCAWFASQMARADIAAERMSNLGMGLSAAGLLAELYLARKRNVDILWKLARKKDRG